MKEKIKKIVLCVVFSTIIVLWFSVLIWGIYSAVTVNCWYSVVCILWFIVTISIFLYLIFCV